MFIWTQVLGYWKVSEMGSISWCVLYIQSDSGWLLPQTLCHYWMDTLEVYHYLHSLKAGYQWGNIACYWLLGCVLDLPMLGSHLMRSRYIVTLLHVKGRDPERTVGTSCWGFWGIPVCITFLSPRWRTLNNETSGNASMPLEVLSHISREGLFWQ